MSTIKTTYTVFATGVDSAEGAPVPGFVLAGKATFGITSTHWDVLPALRAWIREQGGVVTDETGTPQPAVELDEDGLYAVSLGPSEDIDVQGVRRVRADCPECGAPVVRLEATGSSARADGEPTRLLVSTVASCWLARVSAMVVLDAAGLKRVTVGSGTGCWPDRLLASHTVAGQPRCGVCLQVPVVPRYSLGLLVERPVDPSGWWWHARLGQHLPILSGDLVARLRDLVELAAVPVLTDPATAFLPEELR